jgi:hypothetical protein
MCPDVFVQEDWSVSEVSWSLHSQSVFVRISSSVALCLEVYGVCFIGSLAGSKNKTTWLYD